MGGTGVGMGVGAFQKQLWSYKMSVQKALQPDTDRKVFVLHFLTKI